MTGTDDPEHFWAEVLSGEPGRVRAARGSLNEEEAAAVRAHLRRMATEDGWLPTQRVSARAALDVFEQTGSAEAP